VDLREAAVSVGGVEEQSVREHLDPLGDVGQIDRADLVLAGAEPQLHDLFGRVLLDELAGLPSAAKRPWSMTTSRSQSCSASSM